MARRKRKRFAGTPAQHRSDAAFNAKEARRYAQNARINARRGDCEHALINFGLAAFHAGKAIGNRKWVGGKRGKLHQGGSHLGGRIADLQHTVLRACRIAR